MENHWRSTDFPFNTTDDDDDHTYHHPHLGILDDNQLNGHDGQLKTMEDDTGSEAH